MNRQPAEQAVRQVESEYDRAWGEGDVDALIACLWDDAVVVSPRGDVARGHGEVRTLIGAFLADEARESQHTSTLIRIELVTANVAVVDGEACISSQPRDSDPIAVDIRHGFTDVLVEHGGHWRISHVRAYQLPTK